MTGYAVDLFCGCGGASEGLRRAGYTGPGFDHWSTAVNTHNANGLPALEHDLSNELLDALLIASMQAVPDLLWGSPPCQPWSAAGNQEGADDERDGLPWFLRIAGKVLAPVVIMENVKGLTFDKNLPYLEQACTDLRAMGYDVAWNVLNCADYGIPQTRERLFVIARRDGGVPTWPTVTHTEAEGLFTERWVSMADALGWNPALRGRYARGVGLTERGGPRPDARADQPAPTVTERMPRTFDWRLNTGRDWKPGGTRDDAQTLELDQPAPAVSAVPGQWWFTRPATTIAGDPRVFSPGNHFANDGRDPSKTIGRSDNAIRVTLDELAALQGFPPDWIWTGNRSEIARQIGNAVPPRMAQVLAEANRPKGL